MAVTKVITYTDSTGAVKTTSVQFDLEKLIIGASSDEEKIFLVASAPGLTSNNYWRWCLDGITDDAIFASGTTTDSRTRYVHPSGSVNYGGYGVKIDNSGLLSGISGVPGLRYQLIVAAG